MNCLVVVGCGAHKSLLSVCMIRSERSFSTSLFGTKQAGPPLSFEDEEGAERVVDLLDRLEGHILTVSVDESFAM